MLSFSSTVAHAGKRTVSTAPPISVDFFAMDSHKPLQPHTAPISRDSSIGSSFSGSSFSSLSYSEKSPPKTTSPLPPLSRFFPSRYTSLDDPPQQPLTLRIADYDQDDTSTEETPRPDHSTPRALSTGRNSIPPFIPEAGLPPNGISLNTPLSLSIGVFPTPFSSRPGSEYEPSPPPQVTSNPRRLSREFQLVSTPNSKSLHPGSIISACEGHPPISLTLLRTLGQGSFSSVWLACDVSGTLEQVVISRKASIRRLKSVASDGVVRRKSSRRSTQRPNVSGTKPWRIESGTPSSVKNSTPIKDGFDRPDSNEPGGRLVAVKLTDRAIDDRTRVSFIREVEILRVWHSLFTFPLARG